jgi:hypothetical protein
MPATGTVPGLRASWPTFGHEEFAMDGDNPVLARLQGAHKRYGKVEALRGVDLALRGGGGGALRSMRNSLSRSAEAFIRGGSGRWARGLV